MTRTRGTVLAVILAFALLSPLAGGGSAGACSLIATSLAAKVPAHGSAGATATVTGMGFFNVEGDLAADCSGATLTAMADVEVVATWTTPDRDVVDVMAATIDADTFDLAPVSFPVPAGAFSVSFEATSGGKTVTYAPLVVDIDEMTPTTTTTPPTTTTTAGPVGPNPVPAPPVAQPQVHQPNYTG